MAESFETGPLLFAESGRRSTDREGGKGGDTLLVSEGRGP